MKYIGADVLIMLMKISELPNKLPILLMVVANFNRLLLHLMLVNGVPPQ